MNVEDAWLVLNIYGAAVSWGFVVGYALAPRRRPGQSRWRRWWRSPTGWNLMLFAVLIATSFTLIAVSAANGPWPRWVWVFVVGSIAVLMTHQTALVVHNHREREDD